MYDKLRSKKDARLYFRFKDLNIDLGKLKTELIKLGYIQHVEGDRYIELKKMVTNVVKKELLEMK